MANFVASVANLFCGKVGEVGMIQIDIPMPDGCSECRFDTESGFCKAMPANFCGYAKDYERPEWCPLKEQEAKYPVCEKCGKEIDHINTSVFNYDGSDSDYSIPITYSKENGCVSFSTNQKWTGYDLTDEEQKERINCPYCGKFPFDDSIEIEFYEPVEVMMWTSEGQ